MTLGDKANIVCRLCGTQHCEANNDWEEGRGGREKSERVRQTAVDSWGKSHWRLLHGCSYCTFISATVGSLRFKSAPSVQCVRHADRWQPYRCLNSAPCWPAAVESPPSSSTNKKQTLFERASNSGKKISLGLFTLYMLQRICGSFATMEIVKWANNELVFCVF